MGGVFAPSSLVFGRTKPDFMEDEMGRRFTELARSEQLFLVGHCLNAFGVLLLSIGSIFRTAGSLPEVPLFRADKAAEPGRLTAKEYF